METISQGNRDSYTRVATRRKVGGDGDGLEGGCYWATNFPSGGSKLPLVPIRIRHGHFVPREKGQERRSSRSKDGLTLPVLGHDRPSSSKSNRNMRSCHVLMKNLAKSRTLSLPLNLFALQCRVFWLPKSEREILTLPATESRRGVGAT